MIFFYSKWDLGALFERAEGEQISKIFLNLDIKAEKTVFVKTPDLIF